MIIDLNTEIHSHKKIKVGDTLIFSNGTTHDTYIVIHNPYTRSYQLFCPKTCFIKDSFEDMGLLTDKINKDANGFKLVEILKLDEVVMRRVADEQ